MKLKIPAYYSSGLGVKYEPGILNYNSDMLTTASSCQVCYGFYFFFSLTGTPPFVADTEEKLYELIKKGVVDFSDPCWDTCQESGEIMGMYIIRVHVHVLFTSRIKSWNTYSKLVQCWMMSL